MTQESATNEQNTPSLTPAGAIDRQADAVVRLLTTAHRKKKNDRYNIYEDDRIRICLDTYVPNTAIKIPAGEDREWTTVFSASHDSPDNPNIFRLGRWTRYLEQLYQRALEVQGKQEAERERKQNEDRARRYEPVDDAAVYPDIPATTG